MTPEPHQHPDFRLPASRAVRHLLSAVLNHLVVVTCYGSPRKLTQNPIPFPPEPYCCSWEVCYLCYRTPSFPNWKWAMCSMIRSLGSVFYPVYISSLNHSYLIFPLPHHLILPFSTVNRHTLELQTVTRESIIKQFPHSLPALYSATGSTRGDRRRWGVGGMDFFPPGRSSTARQLVPPWEDVHHWEGTAGCPRTGLAPALRLSSSLWAPPHLRVWWPQPFSLFPCLRPFQLLYFSNLH